MKIIYNGHEIEITAFGTMRIFYDGKLISSKKFFSRSPHIFSVREDGENVQYEINAGLKWHGLRERISIRRDGRLLYSDHYREEELRIERSTSLTRLQKFASGSLRVAIVALFAFAVTASYMNNASAKKGKIDNEIDNLKRFERIYIKNMTNQIVRAVDFSNPVVRDYAASLVAKYPGDYNPKQICSLYDDVYEKWRYINDPKGEYISPASRTIQNGFIGDCDDYAVLMCSLIESVGGDCRIVLAFGKEGNHAYPEAKFEPDQESADSINSYYADIFRKLFRVEPVKNSKGPVREINYHVDADGVWLNLDQTSRYPGGKFFEAEKLVIIYPNGSYKVKEKGEELKRTKYLRMPDTQKGTITGRD